MSLAVLQSESLKLLRIPSSLRDRCIPVIDEYENELYEKKSKLFRRIVSPLLNGIGNQEIVFSGLQRVQQRYGHVLDPSILSVCSSCQQPVLEEDALITHKSTKGVRRGRLVSVQLQKTFS